jgi:hypothetical protein
MAHHKQFATLTYMLGTLTFLKLRFMICKSPRSPEGTKGNMSSAEEQGHKKTSTGYSA